MCIKLLAFLIVHRNRLHYTIKPEEYLLPLWCIIIGQLIQYRLLHCHPCFTYFVFIPCLPLFQTRVVSFTMTGSWGSVGLKRITCVGGPSWTLWSVFSCWRTEWVSYQWPLQDFSNWASDFKSGWRETFLDLWALLHSSWNWSVLPDFS